MGTFSKMMNKIPAAVLRSPLHPLMSKKYLLLSFTGRKSGKKYTTPMSYIREADSLLMTTDSPWWKNLRGEATVTVRVEGHEHEGIGEAVTQHAEVVRVLGRLLDAQPGYGKYIGLKSGRAGQVDSTELETVAEDRIVVRVLLSRAEVSPQ
jgi:deazaflavin-dependent oxidoreductase (nitroreductase family)